MTCALRSSRRKPVEEAALPYSEVVPETVDALILDLLEWIGPEPRPYAEVLDAWRTSCPRLPVWEDANDCINGDGALSCMNENAPSPFIHRASQRQPRRSN